LENEEEIGEYKMDIINKIDGYITEVKSMKSFPKIKGWEMESDEYEVDYYKEDEDGNRIHLVFDDFEFPSSASAVKTFSDSKKSVSTSFEVKSMNDIKNTLNKVEKWGKNK